MHKSYIPKLYPQIAMATLRTPATLFSALVLAVLLGLNPIVASSSLHAQEATHGQQLASININSADAETLAAGLKGVGITRAQEIVRYREAFGPFASVDELVEVKGVGPSTVDKNRAVLTLE